MVAVEELVAVGQEKDDAYQSGSPVSFKAALMLIEADERVLRVLNDPEDPPWWGGRRPTRDRVSPTPPGRALRCAARDDLCPRARPAWSSPGPRQPFCLWA